MKIFYLQIKNGKTGNMEIYVIDIETLLKNFKPYQESLLNIKGKKVEFNEQIDKIKEEMHSLVNSSKSLILGGATQEQNQVRFNELQQEGISIQSRFQEEIVDFQNSELDKNLALITAVVEKWAKSEKITSVVNKNVMVYVSDKYDATKRIINILKRDGLYNEFKEEDYQLEPA